MLSPEALLGIYERTSTIAVVGASADRMKPGHLIPRYLQSQGFRIVPISPRGGELFGEPVFSSLSAVDLPVDAVDVFRPPAEVPDIAHAAVAIGAEVLWLQPGIRSEEGEQIAREAGLTVVVGRCMGVTHGELGLGPGPYEDLDAP